MSIFFTIGGYSASWHMVFVIFGVALFVGFILYDTNRVMKIYGPDDAIMASIELYLDILNLFLYILEMLSSMQGNQS